MKKLIQWCGLFYKLVKSIWIIAFGSKTGLNEHGNVPLSDFRFKIEKSIRIEKSRITEVEIKSSQNYLICRHYLVI